MKVAGTRSKQSRKGGYAYEAITRSGQRIFEGCGSTKMDENQRAQEKWQYGKHPRSRIWGFIKSSF